jgi:MFS family permease
MILLGSGIGAAGPALMQLSMAGATPSDAGLASGLVNTAVQVGGALGLAVLATLATTRTSHLISAGVATAPARVAGYHLAFVVAACLVVTAIAIALGVLQPAPAMAEHGSPAHADSAPALR